MGDRRGHPEGDRGLCGNWSELAPSWSEVGAIGASEKKVSKVGP